MDYYLESVAVNYILTLLFIVYIAYRGGMLKTHENVGVVLFILSGWLGVFVVVILTIVNYFLKSDDEKSY